MSDILTEQEDRERRKTEERERRHDEDRREFPCSEHATQHKEITKIGNFVARQDGQWKILLWGIALVFGTVAGATFTAHNNAVATRDAINKIDKSFTVYMLTHVSETKEGFKRISENNTDIMKNRQLLHEHNDRLKALEFYKER